MTLPACMRQVHVDNLRLGAPRALLLEPLTLEPGLANSKGGKGGQSRAHGQARSRICSLRAPSLHRAPCTCPLSFAWGVWVPLATHAVLGSLLKFSWRSVRHSPSTAEIPELLGAWLNVCGLAPVHVRAHRSRARGQPPATPHPSMLSIAARGHSTPASPCASPAQA